MGANFRILILLAHAAFISMYALLVTALLWHYRRYSLPKDKARWIIGAFLFFGALLALLSTYLLFLIPWEQISLLAG